MEDHITDVFVTHIPIRLGQFLKLGNLVNDGLEAKVRIQYGEVLVNGVQETRRGRQLIKDDLVGFQEQTYRVVLNT